MTTQSEKVQGIFMKCLFKEEELIEEGRPPENAVLVDGIQNSFGFHPDRLDEHKEDIVNLIKEIVPDEFLVSGGRMDLVFS